MRSSVFNETHVHVQADTIYHLRKRTSIPDQFAFDNRFRLVSHNYMDFLDSDVFKQIKLIHCEQHIIFVGVPIKM